MKQYLPSVCLYKGPQVLGSIKAPATIEEAAPSVNIIPPTKDSVWKVEKQQAVFWRMLPSLEMFTGMVGSSVLHSCQT
jgi:hypothetical protein